MPSLGYGWDTLENMQDEKYPTYIKIFFFENLWFSKKESESVYCECRFLRINTTQFKLGRNLAENMTLPEYAESCSPRVGGVRLSIPLITGEYYDVNDHIIKSGQIPDLEKMKFHVKEFQKLILSARKEIADKYLMNNPIKGVQEIDQFNKLPISKVESDKFVILNSYTTTCGNSTVIVCPMTMIIEGTIISPKEYIGLIIGKQGKNISRICEKFGKKIIVDMEK